MTRITTPEFYSKILSEKNGTIKAKLEILDFFLGLTAGEEQNLKCLYETADDIIIPLIDLIHHSDQAVAEGAVKVLLNLSAQFEGAEILASLRLSPLPKTLEQGTSDNIFSRLLDHILTEDSLITEFAVSTMINMSQNEAMAKKVYECLSNEEVINRITNLALSSNRKYNYLPSLLANLTQVSEVRRILLRQSNRDILGKLLTLIDSENVESRRRGVVSMIRNLCLSVENHEFLLDPKINLMTKILLPLAGPEEFDDEDNEKLPVDLQYLPGDKTREPVAWIRKMLLEIIMQLCATKTVRELFRKHNIYVIIREYHKWETNSECLDICEDVANFLIRTEEEIGVDNLGNVQIPSDLIEKFDKLKAQTEQQETKLCT